MRNNKAIKKDNNVSNKVKLVFILVVVIALVVVVTVVANGKKENDSNSLTLNQVRSLAQTFKERGLTWGDFEKYEIDNEYKGEIYVVNYKMDDKYELSVGSIEENGTIVFIYLKDKLTQDFVDIRVGDVEEFINKKEKE